ncbi:Nuclear cap-binding protein subunit 1 [Aphelenchoides avenae]|nr:Nuclear cap-binding protein subunit 1 [Aphelenchus avenae]
MTDRRRHYSDDEDDDMGTKRKRGPAGVDIGPGLINMIAKVDEKKDASLEANLEELANTLNDNLEPYEGQIIDIIADCVKWVPEKLTIFSTLVGLLNAKSNDFGGNVVARLVSELNQCFEEEEFEIALRIITFLCDMGNARVLTLQSIVDFLLEFLELTANENLQTDYAVYAVMHALPWIGPELNEKKQTDLDEIMKAIGDYLDKRQKLHVKILQVWSKPEPHEQEDYMDCLWAQLQKLKEDKWCERHITRVYVAFDSVLSDALQHNLPSITMPAYSLEAKYPLPRVVFRLFAYTDCPDNEPVLPGSHAIERFLVEEDLSWIISTNHLNFRECAKALLNYHRRDTVPLNYVIVEVIFSQLFRLPETPQLEIFYGALLIELCRVQADSMPQVLAQAAELLYRRVDTIQLFCLDRFVDWFSYHLSNFQYRWSWEEWADCLEMDSLHPRLIFVREVIEKCMRLSYHKKMAEILPPDFKHVIPPEPVIIYVLDEQNHPAYDQAQEFKNLIRDKKTDEEILPYLKKNPPPADDSESVYDPDSVAVFTAVLLKLASKTFSHSFAALTKYHQTFRTITQNSEEMQSVILRTLYDCWNRHKQMLTVLVDKLLKMQIVDPAIVEAWVFCDDMKREFKRSWTFDVLNTAILRVEKHLDVLKAKREDLTRQLTRKKNKLAAAGTVKKDEDEKMDEDEAGENGQPKQEPEADQELEEQCRDIETQISDTNDEIERVEENFRNILLDICHKFTLMLTEHFVQCETEGTEVETQWYSYATGRFRHIFLAHSKSMWRYAEVLDRELFAASSVDSRILDIFNQFRALKR